MSESTRARNWMKIETRDIPFSSECTYRQIKIEDAELLAVLMDRSYQGTIDSEGETLEQCLEEMQGVLSGKYGPFLDFASFVMIDSGKALSASLVTFWKEKPLLTFSMTDPEAQGKGYERFLIERSISALADKGYPEFYLVVTVGNSSAEHLYRKLGFDSLGPTLPS